MGIAQRFKEKYRRVDGCWQWTGSKSGNGYGCFFLAGKMRPAHRVSLLLTGEILCREDVVDHKCRNILCVNPTHLRLVDLATNSRENSMGLGALNAFCPANMY